MSTSPSTADWAARYIRKYRLALVPIPEGSKGPMYEGWSLPGGWVMDAEEAQRRWSTDETSGIGAVLAPSGLCSLDSTEHDYKRRRKRWISPTSSTGLAGVTILEGRVYSHHASDPLADGHAHDAFDLFRILNHQGDTSSAVRAAGEELGVEPQSFGGNSGTSHHDKHDDAEDATGNASAQDILTIRYEPGKLPKNLDEAESALLVRGGVYQRGSLLVRVARIPEARVTRCAAMVGL